MREPLEPMTCGGGVLVHLDRTLLLQVDSEDDVPTRRIDAPYESSKSPS